MPNQASEPTIRSYRPEDLAALYSVCVRTGASGQDATGRFSDDDLLPDIYAGPYAALEPELVSVIETEAGVGGYVLGAADTTAFIRSYREKWLPRFAAKYSRVDPATSLEAKIIDLGYRPEHMLGPDQKSFPAHLHIDMIPELQGRGMGRRLVRTFLMALRDRGVPGVQLGVGERNTSARAFYARLGFRPLPSRLDNPLQLCLPTATEL